MIHTFNSITWVGERGGSCELEASLIYILNPRTARVTWRYCLKQQKTPAITKKSYLGLEIWLSG